LRELREIRLRRGLSQADLSAMTGVAEFTISEIESGKRANPRPSTLRKLAQGLGVEVTDLYGESGSPLGAAPSPQEKLFNNGVLEDERRIAIDYNACRTALEAFCDHWQPALSGKRQLNHQGFQDFKADAASLSRLTRELMGAEMTTLGQQYDEEGDPMFYTERSEFGPAVMRFHDLAIRMDKIGKESFDEDLTSDPEMGELLDLFPKAS
jgi:transcriptional regulator with XRE-family HTH domain